MYDVDRLLLQYSCYFIMLPVLIAAEITSGTVRSVFFLMKAVLITRCTINLFFF